MKKVIKNQKKMKKTMYIVFGVFALALFGVTMWNPSYASEGLMIDDVLDIIAGGNIGEEVMPEEQSEIDEELVEGEDNEESQDLNDKDLLGEDGELGEKGEEGQENQGEGKQGEELDDTEDNIENNTEGDKESNGEENREEEDKDNGSNDKIQNEGNDVNEDRHGVTDENGGETVDGELDNNGQEENKEEKENDIDEKYGFKVEENEGIENNAEMIESHEIYGTGEYDDVKVEVYADTGLFYSGTELVIQAVTGDMYEGVKEVLSGQLENISEEEQTLVAFDISFIYSGEEVQPLTGTVQVKFNYENNEELKAAEENEDQEVKVYHLNDIDEEGNKIGELTGTTVEEVVVNEEKSEEENVMVVEAEMFSIYTIVKQVKEEGPESLENQLANFEYGMISIENPNKSGQGITIMDRNLGAQMTGAGAGANPKSYGYHYQWGNNYGFDSSITQLPDEAITENNVKLDENRVSEYYGRQFVKGNGGYWMVYSINKLWQKEDDEGAQGPCPEGWHVPTQDEWINLWNYYNQSFNSGAGGFASYFQIPFAKRRDYTDAKVRLNDIAAYMWSSTPWGGPVRYFCLDSSRYYNDYTERGYGLSVRCFKDSYVAPGTFHVITYNFEGGKGSIASMSVEDGMTGTKPVDPKKENAIFLGWYLSGENAEFDFTGTIIKEDITLYAKWEMCEEGYSHVKGICYGNPIFTYDANGGIFNNGEKIKNIKYNYADEIGIIGTEYSHTPNLDDNGEKDHWDPRDYSNNLNTQAHVVEIPSASKLKVTIKHGIGSINGDWVSMWIGAHPDYTAGDNYSSSIIGKNGKLGGTYSDIATDIYEVEGDTVTFSFKSAEYGDPVYGNYYGYYAIIEGIDGSKYSTTETVENPTREGYGFAGWYESGTDTMVNVVQEIIPQEIVTDKRFYAKWLENEKEVTFNANGGYFKTGNSQTSEITIKFNRQDSYYIPDIGIQIPSKLSSDMEVQSGWMFAGWYTENGLNGDWGEELNIGKPQTNYVYAKWLPFDDFEVKMGDVKFTIMDRNMGAEDVAEGTHFGFDAGHEDDSKLGFYYQWGNNYGFSNDGLILNSGAEMISNPNYETNPWGPGNYYYNNIFIKPERPIGRWDTENNKNLWGGEVSTNSDEDKQGPCPEGYHVPSYSDWNAVIQSFEKIKSSECNGISNQKCFAIKLKLPFAGLINSTANVFQQGNIGYYWSSSPFNDEKNSKYLFIPTYTTIKLQEIERKSGLSVRCFKNSSNKLIFKPNNGGEEFEIGGIRWWDVISEDIKPENPIKNGYRFLGWYDGENEFIFSGYLETSKVLEAKWEKNPWYTYNATSGSFYTGNERVIKYNFKYSNRYSHTHNVDDKGKADGVYANYLGINDVVTITGAERLYIQLDYATERNRDYLYVFKGIYDKTPTKDMSDGQLYTFNSDSSGIRNSTGFYIDGDTVTFSFYSDSSNGYYGYYAIVSDANSTKDYIYYTDEGIPVPTKTGYNLEGWYTGTIDIYNNLVLSLNPFDFIGTEVVEDKTLYAKWKPHSYTIKFNLNEGIGVANDINATYGEKISLPNVTRDGYIFKGWKSEDGVTYNNIIPEGTGVTTKDGVIVTLTAQWEKIQESSGNTSSGGGGRKSTPAASEMNKPSENTAEIAIVNEHNSADEETDKSSNPEVGQVIAIDGGTQKTVAIKNTEIVATVRNTTHSSSLRFTKEENEAYSFAKSNGLTTTSSIEQAKMNTELTRIQMAKMLSNFAINVLGQEPDTEKGVVKFDDVTNKMDKQYDNAVTKAYQLGIMGQNMKNNEFRPNDEVTRAEFASALSRLLYNTEEGEYKGTGKYYIPHIAKLYNEGIINKADPKMKEKRGYVMIMLMRTAK